MSNQNEVLPFVVIEEMIADHSLVPEDIALNFEFFQHLRENNDQNPRQNERQQQIKKNEKPNVDGEFDSSELLIKTMLEDDGLDPQEIEKIVQEMHESAVVPPKEEEWQCYDEKAFEEENIEQFPENNRDILDGNIEYAPKHEIPDEMKFILEELTNERDKEQESLKLIDKMLAEELQEKDKKIEEEENASEQFINNMLEEEEKKEEEKQPVANCPICLDNLFSQAVFPLYNCKHMFHIECLESYVIEEIKKRAFPIRCPHPECKKEIPEDDVKDTLQARVQYQDIYDEYYIKSYVESNPDQFLHCPTPDCNFVFCLDEGPRFNCPECQKSHCMNCKVEWHNNLTCEQYAEQKKNEGDDYFMKLADQMKYKRCPKCKIYVERIQGCNAMTCSRCHTMFCYECGKQGDGHVCNHKIDPPPSQNEPFSLKKMLFG